jgi:hypothetical protein
MKKSNDNISKFKKIKEPFLFNIENKQNIIEKLNITEKDFNEIKKLVELGFVELILQKIEILERSDFRTLDSGEETLNYEFKCDNISVRRIFFTIPTISVRYICDNVLTAVLSVYYHDHTKVVNTFHITYGKWQMKDGIRKMPSSSIAWNYPGIYTMYKTLVSFGVDDLIIKMSKEIIEDI